MNELHVTFEGRSYTFQPGQTVYIGRMTDNSIVVGDPTVSRRHAQLTWGPVGWLYENLGQARTFENGQEIKQVIVRKPTELALASPQGPVLLLEPLEPAGAQAAFQAGPQAAPFGAAAPAPQPGFGPPAPGYGPPAPATGRPPPATGQRVAMARRQVATGRRPVATACRRAGSRRPAARGLPITRGWARNS